jgi:uncharacterized protein (TIGR02246 family)
LTTAITGQEKIAPPKEKEAAAKESAGKTSAKAAADDARHEADREAIRKQSSEFVQAFAKGDAKAVAAAWTEHGEYHDDNGTALRERAEIEKEFVQVFKEHPKSRVAVEIESIRFPSHDLAVEEGVIRQLQDGKELPSSTRYRALHVREDGQWKTALCREWGSGQDRLYDLIWLLGDWKGSAKDEEMDLSFEKDKKTPSLVGHFSKKSGGEVVASGTLKISLDPQTSHLRSWHFDDNGGHGQSLWTRDGNRWVLDAVGVEADGTETACVNILTRINNDTAPVKLTRVAAGR